MIIGLWGDKFIQMLENPTFWVAAGILSIAIFIQSGHGGMDWISPLTLFVIELIMRRPPSVFCRSCGVFGPSCRLSRRRPGFKSRHEHH